MPTKTNVSKLDNLQASLAQMLELKRAVDRVQGEIRLQRKKRAQLLGEEEPVIKGEEEEESKGQANRVSSYCPSTRLCSCSLLHSVTRIAEQAQRFGGVFDGLDQTGAPRVIEASLSCRSARSLLYTVRSILCGR